MAAKPLTHILYIDDEPDLREVATLALEAVGGFDVVACASGAEGLAAAAARPPDLFLLDVMMPGMDGPATLRALRAEPKLASIPAVFMTAKAQRDEVAELLALGAAAVVAKPFDPMRLSDQLREIW